MLSQASPRQKPAILTWRYETLNKFVQRDFPQISTLQTQVTHNLVQMCEKIRYLTQHHCSSDPKQLFIKPLALYTLL